ncbi:GNAT family N-acetyltransferase [Sedimenticola sp.]|uniref:GNAT family N-acetyltransferase n=1 Tax=Sedimenticola sp. TaxID=1940285 RepID=UPI003D0F30F3
MKLDVVRLQIAIHSRISEIPAAGWNGLVRDNNPLIRHEFLHAMEQHDCVGERFGWLPRHIAVYRDGQLVAAMPLYEKHNSYGEFVFDNAWADAYHRAGLAYFPKLVSAVPYTPASGQRLLAAPGEEATLYPVLLETVLQLADRMGASSFHCLFPADEGFEFLAGQGLLTRHDVQFHWHNRHYRDFDQFLDGLVAKKRKNIRQERRRVVEAGVTLRRLNGHTASTHDWQRFTHFYNKTFSEKWGMATFNYGFFREVAAQLPDQVLLVLADLEGECIAGSLMYQSDTTLYGRHWGSDCWVDGLHFEACYYQGIEHCIEQGLACFEPGAQGEHKLPRGFVPTLTRSSHWIRDDGFRGPIARYTEHEQAAIAAYLDQLQASIPYREAVTE